MPTLYGIKACDTMKKTFTWLDQHGIEYQFHDYKKAGAPEKALTAWIADFGWETVINQRGTTWRKLPEKQREAMDADTALAVAMDNPSIIKRPILVHDKGVLIGFDPEKWSRVL